MKSIEFIYNTKTYYALIRTTVFETHRQHYATIMNGKLEALFFGHHSFIEQGGDIRSTTTTTDTEINELKKCIREALYRSIGIDNILQRTDSVEKYSRIENEKAVA